MTNKRFNNVVLSTGLALGTAGVFFSFNDIPLVMMWLGAGIFVMGVILFISDINDME